MSKLPFLSLAAIAVLSLGSLASAGPGAGAPQVSGATATPSGPYVLCCLNSDFVNIRAGPAAAYDALGVLVAGQTAEVLGRSVGGDWIQIRYPAVASGLAWVYAPIVRLYTLGQVLPVVEPPPTPTPRITATIDPTFAAQFSSALPTRLPTFTPATPPTPVSFQSGGAQPSGHGLPPALIIIALAGAGVFSALTWGLVGRR